MSQIYNKLIIKLPKLFFKSLKWIFFCFCITSCQHEEKKISSVNLLTEEELTYQKGLALYNLGQHNESAEFFLKLINNPHKNLELTSASLWNLSQIYQKNQNYDKAVFALTEIQDKYSNSVSNIKIDLALAKNYLRLDNFRKADFYFKKIDTNNPLSRFDSSSTYNALFDNMDFNYDLNSLAELQFLGKSQKYFIFIMEQENNPFSGKSFELLKSIYQNFFILLDSDKINPKFKRQLAAELLSQLRVFDQYVIDGFNAKVNTIQKFHDYSLQKQKFLTDWLHL